MPRLCPPPSSLAFGLTGYYADNVAQDDCFRAAIATALQTPIEQVPDPRLHARWLRGDDPARVSAETWATLNAWLDQRGRKMTFHTTLPNHHERWLGICEIPPTNPAPFADHCLVMRYAEILFDPSAKAIGPAGLVPRQWRPSDVTYGLTFDTKE